MVRWWITIFVLISVYVTPSHSSAPHCSTIFRQPDRIVEMFKGKWSAVDQCSGTCYFEATVSHLEATLTRHYKEPVTISRVYLFAELVKARLSESLGKSHEDFNPDFIYGGSKNEIMKIVSKKGLLVLGHSRNSRITQRESLEHSHIYAEALQLYAEYLSGHIRKERLIFEMDRISQQVYTNISRRLRRPGQPTPNPILKIESHYFHEVFNRKNALSYIRQAVDNNHTLQVYFNLRLFDYIAEDGTLVKPRISLDLIENGQRGMSGGHAVLIIGYRTNARGQMTDIILRNSWGNESGINGNFYMPVELFLTRTYSMSYIEVVPETPAQ